MIIENVFGNPIIRILCEDENLYSNEDLVKSVDHVLNMPSVQNRKRNEPGDSHKGFGLTSVGQPYLDLVHLPGSFELVKWITEQLLVVHKELGIDKEPKSVYYKRSWANRFFRGGHGLCHNHVKLDKYLLEMTNYAEEGFRPDAVAILYVDVPEGSSDLVFIRNGKGDTHLDEYDEDDKYYLKPKKGELVIHSPEVYHGVSVHNSDLPRNVFVFDIDYEYN
jgi:hypothetical protein